jgi:hypothetical protein
LQNISSSKLSWEISTENGDIHVTLDRNGILPLHVNLWYSYSCPFEQRRDYRFVNLDDPCTCGAISDGSCINFKVIWSQISLQPILPGGSQYIGHIAAPTEKGQWVASFVDVTYRQQSEVEDEEVGRPEGGLPITRKGHMEVTTQVSIWPLDFPFEDCYMETCYGMLL